MKLAVSFLMSLFLLSQVAIAEVGIDSELEKRVKDRLYVGGADEEDIKVNPNLKAPVRDLSLSHLRNEVYEDVLKEESAQSDTQNKKQKTSN